MPELPEELPEVQALVKPPKVLAEWDQDGSALTDIMDGNDMCQPSIINDDPEAVAQVERMSELAEREGMEDFGLSPIDGLVEWLMDVAYECQVGISLEVHHMKMQFWETFENPEIPQPATPENTYSPLL
jgi:hypothetical protein